MSRIDEINTILDDLGAGATYDEIEYALRDYGKREVLDVLADRSLSVSGGFPITVLSATVTLDNDQIRALPSQAVEIVAAPGLNKLILPLTAYAVFDVAPGGYVADAGSTWQLLLGTREMSGPVLADVVLTGAPGTPIFEQFPSLASPGTGDFDNYVVAFGVGIADRVNQPLAIKDDYNGVSDYTGGDPSNSLAVTVIYTIVDV